MKVTTVMVVVLLRRQIGRAPRAGGEGTP